MEKIKTVLIVGLGALGRIYAVKLSKNRNVNLRIIADSRRIDHYKTEGVYFNDDKYSFSYITPDDKGLTADLVIVATKEYDLNDALDSLKNFIGEKTSIISVLNGITSEAAIRTKYPNAYVPYASFLGHISTHISSRVTHDGVGTIYIGDADNSIYSEKLQRITDFFNDTGIDYVVPQNMLYQLWSKFMVNVGFNQASVVLDANYRVFQTNVDAVTFANNLMMEVVKVAQAANIPDADKMLELSRAVLKQMPPDAKSSMYQDYEAKRPMEIDTFGGEVSRLGKQYGIPTPWNDAVTAILHIKDEMNRGLDN